MEQQEKPICQDYMPDYVHLYYVDRNDDFGNDHKLLQQCVEKNSLLPLNDKVFDFWDYPEGYYLDEIRKKMDADDLSSEFEENQDEIKDWLYEHDESDPVEDLLKNTSDQTFFYSLGIELDHGWHEAFMATPWRNQSCAMSAYKIRRALGIKKDSEDAKKILELCENSSYGGELRIYFESDVKDMISGEEYADGNGKKDWKAIRFKGYFSVAVWNNNEGSGDFVRVLLDKELPFIRENLQISDQAEDFDIERSCGLCGDWLRDCDKPEFSFEKTKRKSVKKSKAVSQEQEFQRIFDAGGCSVLDSNIDRHRDTYYRNDLPCGMYCPHCGKYWYD